METLGHSQISLTLDTYSHVMPDLQAEAATQIDAALRCGFQNGFQDGQDQPEGVPESQNPEGILVSLNFTSWNQVDRWLRQVDGLKRVA
jgi:hypothetical protein